MENNQEHHHSAKEMVAPTHEYYDTPLSLISPKLWLFIAGTFLLLAGFITWAVFGTIAVTVSGKGVFINQGGLFSVESKTAGFVKDVFIKEGQEVKKGTPLVLLDDPSLELKLAKALMLEDVLSKDLQKLGAQINKEEQARLLAIEKEMETKNFAIEQMEQEIPALLKERDSRRKLYSEGLINAARVHETEQNYTDRLVAIEKLRADIHDLQSRTIQEYRIQEFKEKKLKLLEAKKEVELLRLNQKQYVIAAEEDGKVLEIDVQKGQQVSPGMFVVWMERPDDGTRKQIVYGFVPVEKGKKVNPGDQVIIEIEGINTQEFGYVLGKVESISSYIASQKKAAVELQNEMLANYLNNKEASIRLTIVPEQNSKTVSGLRWTGGYGPSHPITSGTVAKLAITVEKVSPLKYWLPIWRVQQVKETVQ